MFRAYRAVFRPAGSIAFTLTGLAARFPAGMSSIAGTVMLTASGRSYSLAGAGGAAATLVVAVAGPYQARLVDRYGQARVTVPAVLLAASGAAALLLGVRLHAPIWALVAAAVVSGLGPNTGSLVRARWAWLHRGDPAAQHSAYAFESVADEICFILGPIAAIALCSAFFPAAGYLCATALGLAGTLAFTAQRRTEPPVRPAAPNTAPGSALGVPGLRVLVLALTATGAVFGAMEITTVGYATHLGHRSDAGLVLACYALGSCVSGAAYGLRSPRGSTRTRLRACLAAMTLLLAPLMLVPSLPVLAVLLFLAGLATAPTMVTSMALVRELVPAERLTEGFTLTTTGLMLGISAGAALGGWTVDRLAPGAGYRIPVLAAALALLIVSAGAGRADERACVQ